MKVPGIMRRWFGESVMVKLAEARAEYTYSRMKYQCDEGLITIFEELLGKKQGGFYLDVGSNDGRTASNTWHLERELKWTGILVEPVLHLYFESRKLRHPDNVFINAACVDPDFNEPSLKMIYAGLMTVSPDQSSFDADHHAAAGSRFISAHETTETIYVPTMTLDKILEKFDAPKDIDFMSIDVEGAEMPVLRGLNLDIWKPSVICIESNENSEAHKHLEAFGYTLHSVVQQNLILIK
jgi:FkbM family methyltransferase